jgi:hypothetical protein
VGTLHEESSSLDMLHHSRKGGDADHVQAISQEVISRKNQVEAQSGRTREQVVHCPHDVLPNRWKQEFLFTEALRTPRLLCPVWQIIISPTDISNRDRSNQ